MDKNNLKIKLAEKEDIKRLGEFYDKVVLYLEEHVNYPKWMYKIYPCENSAAEKVLKNEQFLIEEDNEIIAAFVLNEDGEGSYDKVKWSRDLKDGEYLVCHTLAVNPEIQAKGIGKTVVDKIIEYAKSKNYKAIPLDAVPQNIPAKKLYGNKCGFTYLGDVDLERNIEDIPEFSMFELNLKES